MPGQLSLHFSKHLLNFACDDDDEYRERDDGADDGDLGALGGVGAVELDLLDGARVEAGVHLADDLDAVLVGLGGVDRGRGQDDREQRRDRRQPEELLVLPPLQSVIPAYIS